VSYAGPLTRITPGRTAPKRKDNGCEKEVVHADLLERKPCTTKGSVRKGNEPDV
jgi:hypothetical protein